MGKLHFDRDHIYLHFMFSPNIKEMIPQYVCLNPNSHKFGENWKSIKESIVQGYQTATCVITIINETNLAIEMFL